MGKIQNRKEVKKMLNQCTLTGNLGGDPEVFYSSEGNPVASFSLASHSSKKKTGWIKLTCFQKLAEVAAKYLHKGARIAVIGTLDEGDWGHPLKGPCQEEKRRTASSESSTCGGP